MLRSPLRMVATAAMTAISSTFAASGADTVGVLVHEPTAIPGYNLFAPLMSTETYLIDNDGRLINSWESAYLPGNSCYLLEDGDLLRPGDIGTSPAFITGGKGGIVERFDWDGNLEWTFVYSSSTVRQHHDVEPLPNGNILMISWELRTEIEAEAMGRDPATVGPEGLWSEKIIEVQQTGPNTGMIVWEWRVWDHLMQDRDPSYGAPFGQPEDLPLYIDINYPPSSQPDWLHINSVDYNSDLDQILVSVHNTDEIWIINHAIDTEEASGNEGNLMYRWGNPAAYGRGTTSDQKFFGQHDARWVYECDDEARHGNIMVFNNGMGRPTGTYSTVEEITPPLQLDGSYTLPINFPFPPVMSQLIYRAAPDPTAFYSGFISGSEPIASSSHTLICSGAWGEFFEIDPSGNIVWLYVNPVIGSGIVQQGDAVPSNPGQSENLTFRCSRYAENYPGFDGRDMTPGDVIEGEGDEEECFGDFNDDGVVDGGDLGQILAAWGTSLEEFDLDGSGLVDGGDMGLLLAAFGPCP